MDDKTEILSRIDFLAEYQKIGIQFDGTEPNAAGWVPCHSIDRDDRNASAAINLQNGFYTDLGNGGRKLDFFALMQIQGGFRSFLDVLNHYRKQFGMEEYHERKNAKNKTPETELDILPWNANGDRWCGLKSTNREAVERAGGFLCRYQKSRMCVGFQVFADPNPDQSATGYVVAQTDGTPLPKFDRSGKQIGEAKYKIVAGTQTGLIGTEALLTIYKAREAGTLDDLTVIKVEGISDLTALLARIPSERRDQIVVLTNACGAGEKPKELWSDVFKDLNVVVVHDSDKPGQTGALVWCQWLEGTAKSVKNVVLPYEISENHGRDLKDYLAEHTLEDFLQLVENAQPAEIPDPNERRKKILESLDLEPIGEYPDQSIAVFSRNGRKLVTIKDVDKLSFTRLLQIAGEPVFTHLDEKDPEGGTITLTDVRNALAICCRANIITADTTRGLGVWKTNRGNIVLVGKGEAGVWNGEEFRIVTSPKLDNILLDFSSGETFWPEDFGQRLADYDPLIGKLAVSELDDILCRWKWDSPKADDPDAPIYVITGLILATFIQTVFDFRPMISVTGESESGKTTLIQTIVSLFGNFGEKLANVTEAAIRQYIGTTARPLFLDEFEYTANRQKILELLRTSSDGSKQIRGTQDQKVRAYGLRHIVWMLAIEIDLQRAPDANRFLEFSLKRPTAEESGKLNLPNQKKLCELGEKLLLAVVWNAPEIIQTAERLIELKIDGKNTREIQNFAAPAAAYACVMGYDPEDTLREFLTNVTRRETPSDQADILETLLMQRIRYQHYRDGLTEYAVGALIEMYYNHTDRREDIQEALMNFGIRVGNDPRTRSDRQREGVFFSKGALTELLKNTQWRGQDAKQILKRLPGVEETRASFNGAATRGVEVPLSYFEFKDVSCDF